MTLEPRTLLAQALRRLDELVTRRVVLCVAWGLFLVYCYPGYMSTDSVDQIQQARGEPFDDWHPPMMAFLWRYLDRIIAGPILMVVLQGAAFLFGLDAILRRLMSPRAAAVAASAIFLSPPVLVVMAVVWKDSQMAGFLVAGVPCLLSERRRWTVVGCLFLFLASGQRFNAPAATLPIVVLLFAWPGTAGLRRYAIAGGVWIAITAAAFGANAAITQRHGYAWHGSVALFDIVGMVTYAPTMSDDEVRTKLAGISIVPTEHLQGRMRAVYNPRAWYFLAYTESMVLAPPQDAMQRAAVTAAWRRMLMSYPRAYFDHRLKVFNELLGLGDKKPRAVWDRFTETEPQWLIVKHRAQHSRYQAQWVACLRKVESGLLFRAWAYALLAFALLPLCRRQRLAFALLGSGLVCELSLFVSAPSADYRYSHWMISCTIVAAVMIFIARWRSARPEPTASS